MDDEFEDLLLETKTLRRQLSDQLERLTQRWTAAKGDHLAHVEMWGASRPHSRKLEKQFLRHDKAILDVNIDFQNWLRRYSSSLREHRNRLVPPLESENRSHSSDYQRLRNEMDRNLRFEIPRLEDIVNCFESAVRSFGYLNSGLTG